jgi:hypothetical protein
MIVRGDLDKPFVWPENVGGVRLEASDLGFFFHNIWEIPMVVAQTNSKWDL